MAIEKPPDTLIATLKEEKSPPSIIFLYGPDTYTRNRLISQIVEHLLPSEKDRVFGLEEWEARETDPGHLLSTLKTLPMGQRLKVVVLQRFEMVSASLLKEEKKRDQNPRRETDSGLDNALLRYVAHPSRNTLLLISSAAGLRKNSRLYRALPRDAILVSCSQFSSSDATRFVRAFLSENGKRASATWVEQLIEMVGPDAARLASELEKILLLSGERETLTEKDLEIVSATEMPRDVFALLNAITAGQKGKAMEIIREILQSSEPPLRILAVLSWHYHLVLKAWALFKTGNQKGLKRLHPSRFVVDKITRQARGMSSGKLKRIFTRLRETDRLLKGSRLPPLQVMEQLVFVLSTIEGEKGF